MRKIIVNEWLSLDGTFDSSSMDQWFNPYHSESRAKSIQATIHDCEIMLYGKNTYQMLAPYWSSLKNNEMGVAEKMNKVKKYVVSTSLKEAAWENTVIINKDVVDEITTLKKQEGGNILIQGSAKLVRSLLGAGLVDEFNFLIQPHIMGTNTGKFFEELNGALDLRSLEKLEQGVLQVRYVPRNNKPI
jgi:dihydrofolate reductase